MLSVAPKLARFRVPAASRLAASALGSGARVKTMGRPVSAATSAATIVATSPMRRCSTSTPPAARSSRRSPRPVSMRSGHACAAGTVGPHSGMER